MSATTPLAFRKRALLIALAAFALVLILWNIPQLGFLLYPFRLFVTFVHESGHGLAALISGGHFEGFVVHSNGSGVALTAGGSRALILPAGYLGAALFGAVLFYLANSVPYSRVIAAGLGIALGLITILYTDLLSVAFLVGLASAALLLYLGRRGHTDLTLLVLNLLAMVTALNAVLDLLALINNSGATLGAVRNDAAAFSAEIAPLIPPVVFAALWVLLALIMLGAAIYFSIIRRWRARAE